MSQMTVSGGDITYRQQAYAVKTLLKEAYALEILGKYMKGQTLPNNSTNTMSWRGYSKLPLIKTAAVEGVTPNSTKLIPRNVSLTLKQLISIIEITDTIADTVEDPILTIASERGGKQMIQSIEWDRFVTLAAGSNVFYANGTAVSAVNTAITATLQKKIVRALKRQDANTVTKRISSTPDFNTESTLPGFIAVAHTDLEGDIRAMTDFIDAKEYGGGKMDQGELGSVGPCRYFLSNLYTVDTGADAGGAKGSMVSTSGVSADVYSIIYFGEDAWDSVAFRGMFSATPMVLNPNTPRGGDPAGQRGSVAFKSRIGTVITNDAWMAVAKVAATDL